MKKRLTISLTIMAILMFAFAVIAGCAPTNNQSAVKEIKIKESTVKSTYVLDNAIDYSKIYIVVTKEDGTTTEIKLTDSEVEFEEVDLGADILSEIAEISKK